MFVGGLGAEAGLVPLLPPALLNRFEDVAGAGAAAGVLVAVDCDAGVEPKDGGLNPDC